MKSLPARLAILALGVALLTGCQAASFDAEFYTSTVDKPLTFSLVAAQTGGAVLWTYEVPVNHKLFVDIDRKGDFEIAKVTPEKPPYKMDWALFDIYDKRIETGTINLPGVPVYRKIEYRPAPEWPPGFVPPGTVAETPPVEIIEAPKPPEKPEGDADKEEGEAGDEGEADAGEAEEGTAEEGADEDAGK
jgi:hypothetical protein